MYQTKILSCFLAHNGNLFDFPILFKEIQSALSTPPYSVNNSHTCIDEIHTSLPIKDSSVQTTNDYYTQTSLFSIDCADSLVFFREMHRLLDDKDIVQYPIENIRSEPLTISNQNGCNNNESIDTTKSSSHLGYVEIPIKYIPSLDPARQQPSMKLVKIYEREFNEKTSHFKSHRAEDDCLMLLAILIRYLPDWLEWIELNHCPLNHFDSLPLSTTNKPSPNTVVNRKPRLKF
jgi:DNA polymerase III epsilon subunit-like protein